MTDTLSSIPAEPLDLDTVLAMEETYEYAVDDDTGDVVAMLLLRDKGAFVVGYDPTAAGWIEVATGPSDATNEEIDEVEAELEAWIESTYADRDDFAVSMTSPGQRKKNRRPKEVEMGLEPEFDCPDCDYYKTGLSVSPHDYQTHLEEEHGYTEAEAIEIRHE